MNQKVECRNQAYGVISEMIKLETRIMTILWNGILERFQASSASLQSPDQDLNTGYALYESLKSAHSSNAANIFRYWGQSQNPDWLWRISTTNFNWRKRNIKYDDFSSFTMLNDDAWTKGFIHKEHLIEGEGFIVMTDNVLSALAKYAP